MQNNQHIVKDSIYLTGIIHLMASVLIFGYPLVFTISEGNNFLLFFLNYSIAGSYFIITIANRKRITPERKLDYRFLLLIMFLVSAYSLNREMNVFESSVGWLSVSLVLSSFNYILYSAFSSLPNWAKQLSLLISGFSFVLFLYMTFYLLPLYGIGLGGFLALGISLHVFVPVLFVINTIFLVKRASVDQKNTWRNFFIGTAIPLIVLLIFSYKWINFKKEIEHTYADQNRNDLPAWIRIAQRVTNNPWNEKMLKAGLVYTTPDDTWDNILWRMPDMNFNEQKKHDPLVMCASFFNGSIKFEGSDQIQILKTNFNSRHKAEDRLWNGEDLITENVNTEVKIWPACNIGYTEKTITVRNTGSWQQEEGLYTFYLPEAAVVTSLSLWINGKEEKGILTTKQKADSAYKTIVSKERRDPSIVHWQEGNRVTLRVFPVLAGESRKFKIGITAPLKRTKGKLEYENIYFDGPDESSANEFTEVDFQQQVTDFQIPATFISKSAQSYRRQGKYEPHWNLVFPDEGLSGCSFSFDDYTYSLSSYHKRLTPVNIQDVYLDINSSWAKKEFNDIIKASTAHNLYVNENGIVQLTEENKDKIFGELVKDEFSLFPLYKIKRPESSIVITKASNNSCNIDDLEQTVFIDETKKFLSVNPRIKLFNIGTDLSPYLKSLKEFRVFQYDDGDVDILSHLLKENIFVDDEENNDRVIIHKTDMVIERLKQASPSSGPDHIMRLFAYNHIMQKLGTGLMLNRPIDDQLVEEAKKAYVVTPLSSLVVLETESDYKRFDINDSNNSLKNASLGSKGAAPEPGEWFLIIAGVSLIIYIKFRRRVNYIKA